MLLLLVQYSETAINVNIFMRGGLAYSHAAQFTSTVSEVQQMVPQFDVS